MFGSLISGSREVPVSSQNHRMVWVQSNLRDHLVPSPPVGRGSFHQTRLFPVLGQAVTFWARGMACAGGGFQALGGSLGQHLLCQTQLPEALCLSPPAALDRGWMWESRAGATLSLSCPLSSWG